MQQYTPIEFTGGNLGQRHKHINQCVNDAIKRNVSFEDIKSSQEISVIDKLFKIDVASKCKNVDYLIESLKERNMLYVSRALKSRWLVTDTEYADIINPQYLEEELYPKMLTTGVNKMRHFVYINLKDETRCNEFYWYYKTKENLLVAKHFLPKCSEEIIMNEIDVYIENVTPHYLKLVCEKCPRVLQKYFFVYENDTTKFKNFINDINTHLNVTKILLKSQPELYFEMIERYCSTDRGNKRLSPKATKYIMQKHKDKYMAKPELYGGWLLHLPTLARCLSEQEVQELVLRLARAQYLAPSFTLTYKSAEPLLERISKEEKPHFVKKIFKDKDFGSAVKEAPYPLPEVPLRNFDDGLFTESDDIQGPVPLCYRSDMDCGYRLASKRFCKKSTLLDELFDKYRFTSFSKTFTELKKLMMSESSHKNRLMILNVIVSKTLKHPDRIHMLLELVSTRHSNEPSTLRAGFLRSLVRRAAAYRLPEEPWQIFQKMVLQVVFQSEEQVPCDEGLHAILIHDILDDRDISPDVLNKFLAVFNPLVEYDLSMSEKTKIYQTLHKILVEKCRSHLQENKVDDVITIVDKIFELVEAYKNISEISPEVIDIVKKVSENNMKKSKDILMRLYQTRKCRKLFTKENFILIQNNASYVNALRHDVSLLTDTDKFVELITKSRLKMDEFLLKTKIYFKDLTQKYKLIIEDKLKSGLSVAVNLRLSRAMCILQGPEVILFIRDLYSRGKEDKRLALGLAANLHMAWSVAGVQGVVQEDVAVIASRNALSALPADAVRAQLPALLLGERSPFVRLALALAFDRLLPDDILNTIAHIRQNSTVKIRRVILRKFCKYTRLSGENLRLDLWKQIKEMMMEFRPHYDKQLWKVLSDIKGVPKVIEVEYCLTILSIQFSTEFKMGKLTNLAEILNCLSKEVSALNEDDVFSILKPFLEDELEKETTVGRCGDLFVNNIYIRILTRFLLSCETETIQDERFKRVGFVFLNKIKNSWNKSAERQFIIRRDFKYFLFNLKYNKAFLNDNFVNCLPLFEKVVAEMHTFLDVKRYFNLYSRIHLTMVYYKTLQYIKKQQPRMLSDQTDGAEVASAVGLVFGRYLAREHRQLLTDYFPTITYLYVVDVQNYINEYRFGSGKYFEKFKIAVIQGVALSGEDDCLYFATLMLHNMGFLGDFNCPELQGVYKLITDSKDIKIQTFLNIILYFEQFSAY